LSNNNKTIIFFPKNIILKMHIKSKDKEKIKDLLRNIFFIEENEIEKYIYELNNNKDIEVGSFSDEICETKIMEAISNYSELNIVFYKETN